MASLIDTNVCSTAKNFPYEFDFCPGFWREATAHAVRQTTPK